MTDRERKEEHGRKSMTKILDKVVVGGIQWAIYHFVVLLRCGTLFIPQCNIPLCGTHGIPLCGIVNCYIVVVC